MNNNPKRILNSRVENDRRKINGAKGVVRNRLAISMKLRDAEIKRAKRLEARRLKSKEGA